MTTVSSFRPRTRRNVELVLLLLAGTAEAAGPGAVGRAQAQAGEEIGGVDADSVQFDAAARPSGPPPSATRRPR